MNENTNLFAICEVLGLAYEMIIYRSNFRNGTSSSWNTDFMGTF